MNLSKDTKIPSTIVNLPSLYCLVDNSSLSACTSLITMDRARMYRNPGGQSLNSSVCEENLVLKQDYHTEFHTGNIIITDE